MRTASKICLALFVLLLGYVGYSLHTWLGFFYADSYISPGQCKVLPAPYGPEDLVPFGGHVLSAFVDRAYFRKNPDQRTKPFGEVTGRAGILAVDPETAKIQVLQIEGFPTGWQFHPVGLHGTPHADGTMTLYVISTDYEKGHEVVEVFAVSKGPAVKYLRTIEFAERHFEQFNDLYVFPDGKSFYITTWQPDPAPPTQNALAQLETSFKLLFGRYTDLLLCTVADGDAAQCVAQDHGQMMNGVTSDGKHLFAADSLAGIVNYYDIRADRSLLKLGAIRLEGLGPDNLVYDPSTDSILVGVFRIKDQMAAMQNVTAGEPTHVPGGVAELYREGGEWKSRILLMQKEVSTLSTAVRAGRGRYYVMGTSFDEKILICERNRI